ncbi:MAG: hypothetical protein EBR02_06250 [Alphaproteobacteria bacterium]|nr:hypothetical protein [Alphaproteobacteria bacterium]
MFKPKHKSAEGFFGSITEMANHMMIEPLTALFSAASSNLPAATQALGAMTGLMAAGVMSNPIVLVGLAVISSISAVLTLLDGRAKEEILRQDYAEEIGAKLGKDPSTVTKDDLRLVAKGDPARGIAPNMVLQEKLKELDKSTWMNVAVSVVTTLSTIALMGWLQAPGGLLAEGGAIANFLGHGLPGKIAHGMIGLLSFNLIKAPLKMIGRVFGMDKETTADKIDNLSQVIERGEGITREQVLDVYISSHKAMGIGIQKMFDNKKYDEMTPVEQKQVADFLLSPVRRETLPPEMQVLIDVDAVVSGLNNKRFNSSELAFAVQGDRSGVGCDECQSVLAQPKGLMTQVWDVAKSIFSFSSKSEEVRMQRFETAFNNTQSGGINRG